MMTAVKNPYIGMDQTIKRKSNYLAGLATPPACILVLLAAYLDSCAG